MRIAAVRLRPGMRHVILALFILTLTACGDDSSEPSAAAPSPAQTAPPTPQPPAQPTPPPAPTFDWNDPCPAHALGSVPEAIDADPNYGAGETDPVAFARREAARLIAEGRAMEPYRNGAAGEHVVSMGVDVTGARETGCMQRRWQSQASRLDGYISRTSFRLSNAEDDESATASERLRMMLPAARDVFFCVSEMREGRALAKCGEAERALRAVR